MKAFLQCYSCVIRQTVEILERNVKNERRKRQVLAAVMRQLAAVDVRRVSPPELTRIAHRIIHQMTGIEDLYAKLKKTNNHEALALYPYLKRLVRQAPDPLLMAVKLAIAGNIIDYGALEHFNIQQAVKEAITQKFTLPDYRRFRRDLKKAKRLLYIGDNAGEIVFDRVLIEELARRTAVVFAVKSRPVLNDVLMADAKMVGLDRVVPVIESGSDHAGTTVKDARPEFKKLFRQADLVIAKGQGNFETLDIEKKPIYFMLKMKCPCLARATGFKLGEIILKRSR